MTIDEFVLQVEIRLGSVHILSADDMKALVKQALRRRFNDNPEVVHKTVSYGGGGSLTLPSGVWTVLEVHPNVQSEDLGTAETFLFDFTPIPTNLEDYWLKRGFFKTFEALGGSELDWQQVGDKLLLDDVPSDATALTILYYERTSVDDPNLDITDSGEVEWIIEFATALCLIAEGTRLRKAGMLDVDVDASEMIDQGQTDRDRLLEEMEDDVLPLAIV